MQDTGWIVAVDVGGTTMKGALVDAGGGIEAVERRSTGREEGGEAVVRRILRFVDDLTARARDTHGETCVRGVGLAVPGLVDEEDGVAVAAANLAWDHVPLASLTGEQTGLPTVLSHDVRAAGYAEGRIGAAARAHSYLFVALGTGIGAAVVLDGTACTGSHGVGGEFGHMVVDPAGPECACGRRGCVEAIASAGAVERLYAAARAGGEPINARDVVERAARGEPAATRVWEAAVSALALAVANYAVLLDPEMVVLGGGLAAAGDALLAPLGEQVGRQILFGPGPQIVAAALGSDAGVIGAGLKAWARISVTPAAHDRAAGETGSARR